MVSLQQAFRAKLAAVAMAVLIGSGGALAALPAASAVELYPLLFPVAGEHSFSDTFGAPRSGDRTHEGTDIFAEKMTPVVAAADGTVVLMAIGDLAGRYIVLQHADGWRSLYLHLNNDTPGTDDGLEDRPVDGIEVGSVVAAGDLLDYVGDSGNAEGTSPHLHFELHMPDGTVVNPHVHLAAAENGASIAATMPVIAAPGSAAPGYVAINTTLVGHVDPGGGFTADVVVDGETVFLGSWGRPRICPNTGIRTIDVADPAAPTILGRFADDFPATSTETLWIGEVATPSFTGRLGVVTVRLCDNTESGRLRIGFRGLAFYDLTDVAAPRLLSMWDSGAGTQGSNTVDVALRSDGVLLVATTVRQSLIHTAGQRGDVRFLDATDPATPREVADWDIRRDGRLPPGEADPEEYHAHGVTLSDKGTRAWVSHWDGGSVELDVDDISVPDLLQAVGCNDATGNRHTTVLDADSGLLIVNEENLEAPTDADPGVQHLYDISIPGQPVEVSAFSSKPSGFDGYYTVHDTVLQGSLAISSWYSGGIRIVDYSDPARPKEVGAFIPPKRRDPRRYWVASDGTVAHPMVWGVDVADDLIFASDMHSGLWIVSYASILPSVKGSTVRHPDCGSPRWDTPQPPSCPGPHPDPGPRPAPRGPGS